MMMRCFSTVFIPRLLPYTNASPTVYTLSIFFKNSERLAMMRCSSDGIYSASATLYLCISNCLYSVDLLQQFRATGDDALFLDGIYSASATLY